MKRILKSLFPLLLSMLCLFALTGCTDDFKKETYQKDLDIAIAAEPTSIAALEPEITEIAYEYDEGGVLTQAIAVYQGDTEIATEEGTLYFTFCRNDEEANRGTIVVIIYSMLEQKVTGMTYEQGNGQFTDANREAINEESKQVTFSDLFKIIREDSNMGKKLNGVRIKLTIEFTNEGIKPSLI